MSTPPPELKIQKGLVKAQVDYIQPIRGYVTQEYIGTSE
jgi:hypothetical protein